MDFIETEYFASSLFELIQTTYERCLENLIVEELMQKPQLFIKGVASWDHDAQIHVIKLTTFLYKVYDSNLFQDALANQIKQAVTFVESKLEAKYQQQCG